MTDLEFRLDTGVGILKGKLAVPPTEMRLAELAWNAMALVEQMTALAVRSAVQSGRQVSCAKRCAACCRHLVPLSPPEAWLLADLVASLPRERRAGRLDRFQQAIQILQNKGFEARSLPAGAAHEQILGLGLDYFRLGIPCPFLEDETCSIYHNRPSACREYLVTTPAALCADPGSGSVRGVTLPVSMSECLSSLTAVLLDQEPGTIPLVLALDWALAHREEGQRRWDGVFMITALLAEVEARIRSTRSAPNQG